MRLTYIGITPEAYITKGLGKNFLFDTGFGTQGLHLEPLHHPYYGDVLF
jgi:hypothetical protein